MNEQAHGISLEEFDKVLDKLPPQTYIVAIRQKYSHEKEWEYLNDMIFVDFAYDNYWFWDSDWNKGQQDVEILGYIAVDDITQFKPCGDWRFSDESQGKNES